MVGFASPLNYRPQLLYLNTWSSRLHVDLRRARSQTLAPTPNEACPKQPGAPPLQGSRYPADFADNARTLPPDRCGLTVIADQLAAVAELGRSLGNDPVTGARDEDRTVAELFPLEVN